MIDEIGKMDFASKLFSDVVEKVLGSPAIVMATVMEGPHPFADQIKRRADVVIFAGTGATFHRQWRVTLTLPLGLAVIEFR